MKFKCTTKYCRKRHSKKGPCPKCQKRNQKKNNPVAYTYNGMKSNAKRRGKEFNITLSEFMDLPFIDEYMENKGRKGESLHVDRIDPSKGYEKGNLQLLTNSENVKKMHEDSRFDEFTEDQYFPF